LPGGSGKSRRRQERDRKGDAIQPSGCGPGENQERALTFITSARWLLDKLHDEVGPLS
jgi:hypothetical protein